MSHIRTGDSPSLICKLVARNLRTINVWQRPENSSRYGPPSYGGLPEASRSGRESSLSDDDSNADPDQEPVLNLTFDKMPLDIGQGFVFGSDPNLCDIYCGEPDASYHICSRTFAISINDEGHVVLEHLTHKTVTSVQYNGQKTGTRRKFTWILFPGSSPLFVTAAKKLHFEVILPDHGDNEPVYREHVERYLRARRDATPSPGQLGLGNQPTSTMSSTQPMPEVRRFYYKVPDTELGRGAFGRVFQVRDVSNGNCYAAKEYFGKLDLHEIGMLSTLKHEHIVSYVEHTDEDTPMLIMEYVAGNNLRKQDHEPLHPAEVAALLHQMLLSIQYMHGRPRRVVHRDIKPENILIKTRRPLHAKLGDFGFAWDGSIARGTVGTPEYCAPEVSSYQPYDTPVDIWSLGVVILELLWQPGGMALNFRGRRQGPAWYKYVVELAQSKAREPVSDDQTTKENVMTRIHLVRFLSIHMLKMNPQERRSAEFCLNAGMSPTFRLWGKSSETGRNLATPTDPTAALEEPRTEENVRDKRDPPARQKSSEPQPRRKRDAPDSSSGGDRSHVESPLEAEESKRARLAQEHSGPIPPSAPPPQLGSLKRVVGRRVPSLNFLQLSGSLGIG